MAAEPITLIPEWLIRGIIFGGVATVAVAGIFLIGERYLSSATDAGAGVDGSRRRHAEIRTYLRRIQEPFTEHTTVAGQQVEFLLSDRDVAITFDPQVYLSLESTSVYTILCEHEMPAEQLGRRLPFEVSEYGTAVGPPTDEPVAEAFAELGLPRSADEAAIKEAYRTRVKNVHPDQGGDTDQFRQLQEAYATARDYCRRSTA